MSRLIAIVAMDPKRVIGADGKLPWHLPADLAFFKKTTLGHPVLMGRKTYESIGRPLPKRRNLVLTRDPEWFAPGIEILHSYEEIKDSAGDVFLIGGAQIYQNLGAEIDEWLVTHVKKEYAGDTHLASFEHDFPNVEILEEHQEFTIKRHRR